MDICWFLNERLAFIRKHYDLSVAAFADQKRKIEHGEAPFADPPYSEDGEPAFLDEWLDAETSIDIIGLTCVSLLSDAFKLYLNLLQHRELRFLLEDTEIARLKSAGFVPVYRDALGQIFDTDWKESGVDFDVIEQVVLARNRGQHGTNLSSFLLTHDDRTIAKHPRPFFIRADEAKGLDPARVALGGFLNPTLAVTRETLFEAMDEVAKLASWIEAHSDRAIRWQQAQRAAQATEFD